MKTIWIDLLHHASGNYGVIMDKFFGYKDSHWKWYNDTVVKYLDDPNAPHNKN